MEQQEIIFHDEYYNGKNNFNDNDINYGKIFLKNGTDECNKDREIQLNKIKNLINKIKSNINNDEINNKLILMVDMLYDKLNEIELIKLSIHKIINNLSEIQKLIKK